MKFKYKRDIAFFDKGTAFGTMITFTLTHIIPSPYTSVAIVVFVLIWHIWSRYSYRNVE